MNTDAIFVTVIMCVYNTSKEYLCEAVNSILIQTHKNFELIIVDDASTIEGLYEDEMFFDSRITLIKNKSNKGPGYSRNIALSMAEGKYIAIMDSDDISLPERLEKQIDYLERHKDVVVCGTWYQQFGGKCNEVKRKFDDNEYYRCCLLFGNAPTILNPSVMMRRDVINEYNISYDERLRKAEDYKMWIQMSKIGICTNLPEILLKYRVHPSQTSAKLRTQDVSKYDWMVWKEQFDTMGLELTETERKMLTYDFKSPYVDPYEYYLWLQKLIAANDKTKEYDSEKLRRRVTEQWISKIYNTKNPFVFFKLFFKLPRAQRTFLIHAERDRLKKKIRKD